MAIDLTPFGFTPTESHLYQVLLEHGPGTGYALAGAANLARANAYSALASLVTKGAAQESGDRPKRYRPESPQVVIAKLSAQQTEALDSLAASLEALAGPDSPSLVTIGSARAAVRLISHDIARAQHSVSLVAPPDAYPLLTPVLRQATQAGRDMSLLSVGPAAPLAFVEVGQVVKGYRWPGMPLINVVDDRTAVIAARNGSTVEGHWGQAPAFVASARLSIERLGGGS